MFYILTQIIICVLLICYVAINLQNQEVKEVSIIFNQFRNSTYNIMGAGATTLQTANYISDLSKPIDGSDILQIQDVDLKLTAAKHEAQRYRTEMFKLVTANAAEKQQEAPTSLFYSGKPTINDLCPANETSENIIANCIQYISHVRKLLHLQVQRRQRLSLDK